MTMLGQPQELSLPRQKLRDREGKTCTVAKKKGEIEMRVSAMISDLLADYDVKSPEEINQLLLVVGKTSTRIKSHLLKTIVSH